MSELVARRCRRCLLPATMPGVSFDDSGLCDICQATGTVAELAAARDAIRRDMEAAIEAARGARPYECIVAYSGGKDSSYTLKLLVESYGLRCLAITIDNGFLSGGTYENCRAVCGALGVDHVLYTPSRKFTASMYRTSALNDEVHAQAAVRRASSICSSCISLVNTYMLQKAIEMGTPIVAGGYIGGQLPRDASLMRVRPGRQARIRTAMVDRFARFFGENARPYFELPGVAGEDGHEIVVINPMLGLAVREDAIIAALELLGWRRPTDTGVTSTNCRLNDLGVYLHGRRHGFHPYALEIAEQLRHGLMTEAEAKAKLDALPSRAQVAWLAERIGLPADGY